MTSKGKKDYNAIFFLEFNYKNLKNITLLWANNISLWMSNTSS